MSRLLTPKPRYPYSRSLGPWVTDSMILYRVLRTGTQYIGNWASRDPSPGIISASSSKPFLPSTPSQLGVVESMGIEDLRRALWGNRNLQVQTLVFFPIPI